MSNMNNKIVIALVEGNIIKKSISKIDKEISILARKLISYIRKIEKNKIMFMTYQNDYSCNPKYICDELIRQKVDCEIIFVVNNIAKVADHFPKRVRLVKRGSYEFVEEALTSKIWIDNSINFFWENIPKKKNQILISTWHGSMGLKRAGKEDNKNHRWVKTARRCDIDTDYCISDSIFENEVYKTSHWPTRKILMFGHPRNDLLFIKDFNRIREIKQKVFKKLNIPDNAKIALYAPTFRDSKNLDCYDVDYSKLISALTEKFGGEWIVLARHHFHLWKSTLAKNTIENINGVIRATDYDDMQELMLVADVGITDYSSWICDFVLTRKPGFIFATDIEEYNTERGLYYPLETTPFPIATNNDELIKNVLDFDIETYRKKVEEFLIDKGCVEDGNASKRVVEKIKEIIGAE